jgi:hypothetical protein
MSAPIFCPPQSLTAELVNPSTTGLVATHFLDSFWEETEEKVEEEK